MAEKNKEEITENVSETRIYEVGFHIIPTITADDIAPVMDSTRSIIESAGGMVISEGTPSLVGLAYPMTHMMANNKAVYDSGYFGWVKFEVNPVRVLGIKDAISANENVLRSLVVGTVREDTLVRKTPHIARRFVREGAKAASVQISEEEVDKAIEELVVE